MKLINNRFYFDYNATSPLAPSVQEWIAKGDLPFANPSSIHHSGKQAKKHINETTEFLFDIFSVEKTHDVFYHSGASEGINTIVKGLSFSAFKENKKFTFIHSKTDHSCINNLREDLETLGHKVIAFDVNEDGDVSVEEVVSLIKQCDGQVLLNYTFVNNETGVVWPLAGALEIKKQTGCLVHVDAVQSIGKIDEWKKIEEQLDFYTYSAHKFGGMKGVGFSFVRQGLRFHPLVRGGGQQQGMRSGTENVPGIYSIKLALKDLMASFSYEELKQARDVIEEHLLSLSSKLVVAGANAKKRNANTIYLIIPGQKVDILMTAFDLSRIDISSGSACSSGAIVPSRVLLSMGYCEEDSKSAIRFSFSHSMRMEMVSDYIEVIGRVLKRFLK